MIFVNSCLLQHKRASTLCVEALYFKRITLFVYSLCLSVFVARNPYFLSITYLVFKFFKYASSDSCIFLFFKYSTRSFLMFS